MKKLHIGRRFLALFLVMLTLFCSITQDSYTSFAADVSDGDLSYAEVLAETEGENSETEEDLAGAEALAKSLTEEATDASADVSAGDIAVTENPIYAYFLAAFAATDPAYWCWRYVGYAEQMQELLSAEEFAALTAYVQAGAEGWDAAYWAEYYEEITERLAEIVLIADGNAYDWYALMAAESGIMMLSLEAEEEIPLASNGLLVADADEAEASPAQSLVSNYNGTILAKNTLSITRLNRKDSGLWELALGGYSGFCLDCGYHFSSGTTYYYQGEITDSYILKAITYYYNNPSTTNYIAAQLYIWCGGSFDADVVADYCLSVNAGYSYATLSKMSTAQKLAALIENNLTDLSTALENQGNVIAATDESGAHAYLYASGASSDQRIVIPFVEQMEEEEVVTVEPTYATVSATATTQAKVYTQKAIVKKKVDEDGNALAGAVFKIFDMSSSTATLAATMTTDENGYASVSWTAKSGGTTYTSSTYTYCSNYSELDDATRILVDAQLAKISNGYATYAQAYAAAKAEAEAKVADVEETSGSFTYVIQEVEAPTGYSVTSDTWTYTVTGDYTYTISEEIVNTAWQAKVILKKVDSLTGSAIKSTASFSLLEYNVETDTYEEAYSYPYVLTGDGKGTYTVSGGETDGYIKYTAQNQGKFAVVETQAPSGYSVNDAISYIQITKDGQTIYVSNDGTEEFSNGPFRALIKLWKIDAITGEIIKAVTSFSLYQWSESAGKWVLCETGTNNTGYQVVQDTDYSYTVTGNLLTEGKGYTAVSVANDIFNSSITVTGTGMYSVGSGSISTSLVSGSNAQKGTFSMAMASSTGTVTYSGIATNNCSTMNIDVFAYCWGDGVGYTDPAKITSKSNAHSLLVYDQDGNLIYSKYLWKSGGSYVTDGDDALKTSSNVGATFYDTSYGDITWTDEEAGTSGTARIYTTTLRWVESITIPSGTTSVTVKVTYQNDLSVNNHYGWLNSLTFTGSSPVYADSEDGYLYYTEDNQGKYKIVETASPSGYVLTGNDTLEIDIADGDADYVYYFENTPITADYPYSYVQITKQDALTGTLLSDVGFSVYEWNGEEYVASDTYSIEETDTGIYEVVNTYTGSAAVKNALYYTDTNLGKFMIVETGLEGYADEGLSWEIVISEETDGETFYFSNDGTSTTDSSLVVTNTPATGQVIIPAKVNALTGETLEGAVFALYAYSYAAGTFVESDVAITQQEDGTYVSDVFTYTPDNGGIFAVREVEAPYGYCVTEEIYTLLLSAESAKTEIFTVTYGPSAAWEDVPWYVSVSLEKTDLYTGAVIGAEASFVVQEWNGSTYVDSDSYVMERSSAGIYQVLYTGTNILSAENAATVGCLYWSAENEGKFRIVERTAPTGYEVLESVAAEIVIDESTNGATYVISNNAAGTFDNKPKVNTVSLLKTDAISGETLTASEATFVLYEWNETLGDYEVSTNWAVYAKGDGYYSVYTLESSIYYAFSALRQDVLVYNESNLGKFRIVESAAPLGYIADETPYDFTMDEDGAHLQLHNTDLSTYYNLYPSVFGNKPLQMGLGLCKVSGLTGADIAGDAVFCLYEWSQEAGAYIESTHFGIVRLTEENIENLSADLTDTLFVGMYTVYPLSNSFYAQDANNWGWLYYTEDNLGLYYIEEIQAPTGFEIDEADSAPVYFSISTDADADGSFYWVTNNNPDCYRYQGENVYCNKATLIQVQKTDTAGNPISGATLQVVDAEGNVIDRWVSDGTARYVKGLKVGETYTLEEVRPADGYVTAQAIVFTVMDEDEAGNLIECTLLTMEDDITKAYFALKDCQTEGYLMGGTLQIVDEDGNVYEEWSTSDGAWHVVEMLPVGTYYLVEVVTPAGYPVIDGPKTVSFTIEDTGEIQYVVLYNCKIQETAEEEEEAEEEGLLQSILGNFRAPKTGQEAVFWAEWAALLLGAVLLARLAVGLAVRKRR